MLVELAVRNLGVIPDARVPFNEGMVALTGETGAGKTMIVEALDLLAGGRGDPGRVRPGEDEAVVEA
ncbi:MAG: AAA family ATPase, partial [Actinomycetes bacterium]